MVGSAVPLTNTSTFSLKGIFLVKVNSAKTTATKHANNAKPDFEIGSRLKKLTCIKQKRETNTKNGDSCRNEAFVGVCI